MTNEIKEILDIFKQVDLEADVGGCSNCPRKDKNKTCIGCLNNAKDKLLDYITNLQEENERYKKIFEGKERFSKIMPDDMDFIVMSKTDYDRQVDDIELVALELRSRIDKATEILNMPQFEYDNIPCNYENEIEELKKILRGEDNVR